MNVSDETLMAYLDGELDLPSRAAVEAAIAESPELASRVERYRGLGQRVKRRYDAIIEEPIPDRLVAAVQSAQLRRNAAPAASAKIDGLASVRPEPIATVTHRRRRLLPAAGALAASLALGVIVGRLIGPPAPSLDTRGGALVASGALAQALSEQLASAPPAAAVAKVGISFLARSGDYCRTFVFGNGSLAGLACRRASTWQVEVLASATGTAPDRALYRTAASDMPRAVADAVDETIVGAPLDAEAERSAQQRGWQPAR